MKQTKEQIEDEELKKRKYRNCLVWDILITGILALISINLFSDALLFISLSLTGIFFFLFKSWGKEKLYE